MNTDERLDICIGILARRLRQGRGSLHDVIILQHLRAIREGKEDDDTYCPRCYDTGVIQGGYMRGLDCDCQLPLTNDS